MERKIKSKNIELSEEWQNFVNAMKKSKSKCLKDIAYIIENYKYKLTACGQETQRYMGDYILQKDDDELGIKCISFSIKGKAKKIGIVIDEGQYVVLLYGKRGVFSENKKNGENGQFNYKKRIVLKNKNKNNENDLFRK